MLFANAHARRLKWYSMFMRKVLILFILSALFTAACKKPAEAPAAEQGAAPDVAAKVGPAVITEQDLENKLIFMTPDDQEFAKTPIGRTNYIDALVREKLAELAAKDAKLDESDAYLSALEDKRAQLKEIYDDFAQQMLIRSWYDQLEENGTTAVTEQEVKDYFDKYPYEMTIKQIIIANAETADQVLRALKASPSRWKTLERQYSVAPENTREKEFSFMPGEFIPAIEVIAANSPSGSVQGFIKTSQGFHIIMKTREKRLSFKDAKERIEKILRMQKEDAALNALKNKYEVFVYEKN